MHIVTARLKSVSPYSQSRRHDTPKIADRNGRVTESEDEYDKRTWREHLHADAETDEVFIPPMAFKIALGEAAQYISLKIPGQRNATWTKHFLSGVLCVTPAKLGFKKADAKSETLYLDANGKKNSGTRVARTYPVVHSWQADVEFAILDEKIPENVFRQFLEGAGAFIGIGRFRPKNGGYYGRFEVTDVKW